VRVVLLKKGADALRLFLRPTLRLLDHRACLVLRRSSSIRSRFLRLPEDPLDFPGDILCDAVDQLVFIRRHGRLPPRLIRRLPFPLPRMLPFPSARLALFAHSLIPMA